MSVELLAAGKHTESPPEGGSPSLAAQRLGNHESADPLLDGAVSVEAYRLGELSDQAGADWDDLAEHAYTPNVFYERWNVVPAVNRLTRDDPLLLLVYRGGKRADAPRRLCGLFPLLRGRCARMPISAWRLWGHEYCYLRTPLLRAGQELPALEACLDWIAASRGPRCLEAPLVDGEGPFAQALVDVLAARRLVHARLDQYTRAMLHRAADWQAAAATSLSSHHRRELRRQHRRLQEQGLLTVHVLDDGGDLDNWAAQFLHMENSGWKGAQRTAIAANSAARDYFLHMLRGAHARGKTQLLGLHLDGRPIALKLNLCSGEGSFGFKIAYDERYGKFSPGVQLELESVQFLHDSTSVRWMDSCAVPNHFMINRLWNGRRNIQHVLVSTTSPFANLAIGAIPLCRAVKRTLSRPRSGNSSPDPQAGP